MRRKDREVTDLSEIIEIMKNCDVCRLALNDDGFPYILPLNFGMAVSSLLRRQRTEENRRLLT